MTAACSTVMSCRSCSCVSVKLMKRLLSRRFARAWFASSSVMNVDSASSDCMTSCLMVPSSSDPRDGRSSAEMAPMLLRARVFSAAVSVCDLSKRTAPFIIESRVLLIPSRIESGMSGIPPPKPKSLPSNPMSPVPTAPPTAAPPSAAAMAPAMSPADMLVPSLPFSPSFPGSP